MPPEKYMVKITKNIQNRRLGRYLLDSGYAPTMYRTMLSPVPSAVRTMVL